MTDNVEHRAPLEQIVPVEITQTPAADYREQAGVVLRSAAQSQQVEELKRDLKEAQINPVTLLPNRKVFDDDLGRIMQRHPKTNTVVLFGDLAFMKGTNDTYGHPMGDKYLRTTATGLLGAIRPTDQAYSFGGDEFAVILNGVETADGETIEETVARLAVNMEGEVEKHYGETRELDDVAFPLHLSLGAVLVDPTDTPETVKKRGDKLLLERHKAFKEELLAVGAFPEYTDDRTS